MAKLLEILSPLIITTILNCLSYVLNNGVLPRGVACKMVNVTRMAARLAEEGQPMMNRHIGHLKARHFCSLYSPTVS